MTEIKDLAAALAELQKRLPEIKKTETADVPTKTGGRYSYTYADLAQITKKLMPILGELGLSFIAKPTTVDGQFVLAYKLLHVSGGSEAGTYPLPTSGGPQAIGAAITYARRYCLCAITGVAPDDDDDGAAAQAQAERDRQGGAGRSDWRAPAARQTQAAEDAKATSPQLQKLGALFSQAEWADKRDRLRATSVIVGRELSSSTELTRKEASLVIDKLQEITADPDPAIRLTELVARGGEQ